MTLKFNNLFQEKERSDVKMSNEGFPKCEIRYGPTLAQHRQKFAEDRYRAVAGMITPVCTWRPMLAQTLAASTCFRHSSGPMLCRTLVFSLPGWFAVVKVTHGPVMCRP